MQYNISPTSTAQEFATLGAKLRDDDSVELAPGQYVNFVCGFRASRVRFGCSTGKAWLKCAAAAVPGLPNYTPTSAGYPAGNDRAYVGMGGKAAIVHQGFENEFHGLEISGYHNGDGSAAGILPLVTKPNPADPANPIRVGASTKLTDCDIHDNDNGVRTTDTQVGDELLSPYLWLVRSKIHRNGNAGGKAHDEYVSRVQLLIVDDCDLFDAIVGHDLKSRARHVLARNSRMVDSDVPQSASYQIGQDGGIFAGAGLEIGKGAGASNPSTMIDYALRRDPDGAAEFYLFDSAFHSSLKHAGNAVRISDLYNGVAKGPVIGAIDGIDLFYTDGAAYITTPFSLPAAGRIALGTNIRKLHVDDAYEPREPRLRHWLRDVELTPATAAAVLERIRAEAIAAAPVPTPAPAPSPTQAPAPGPSPTPVTVVTLETIERVTDRSGAVFERVLQTRELAAVAK